MSAEVVTVVCPCGAVHRFEAEHYARFRTKCGRAYWALQPKRGGRLEMFPWPGPNLTREQLAEKLLTGLTGGTGLPDGKNPENPVRPV
jgi:hypothetical protein